MPRRFREGALVSSFSEVKARGQLEALSQGRLLDGTRGREAFLGPLFLPESAEPWTCTHRRMEPSNMPQDSRKYLYQEETPLRRTS
ncbi:unnamed protein product, partial [Gulo gulo]